MFTHHFEATPESPAPPRSPLIFLHIPKTAGTTLWLILQRQYSRRTVVRSDDFSPFASLTPLQRQEMQVIGGHFPYGVDRSLPQPATNITILREPLERVLSRYCHALRASRQDAGESVPSLRDYLTGGLYEVDNLQTRMLAGEGAMAIPFGQLDRDVLEQAKRNIAGRIALTGLTERFDESVVLLQRLFGWKMPCYIHENVGANRIQRDALPRDILQEIWRQTEWDRELYAFASGRLAAQVDEQGVAFADDLRRFRIANVRYKRMRALVNAGPLRALKGSLSPDRRLGIEALLRTGMDWTSALISPRLPSPMQAHTPYLSQSGTPPETPILTEITGKDTPSPHGH